MLYYDNQAPSNYNNQFGNGRYNPNVNSYTIGNQSYYGCSIRKKGVLGLANINNTCFMNSSLQCLTHIKPLYESLKKEGTKRLGKLGISFLELLVKMHEKTEDMYFPPNEIFEIMSSNYPKYRECIGDGANEFITNFLKTFHDELNLFKINNNKEKKFEAPTDKILFKKFMKKYEFYKNNKSLVIDLFYGNLVYLTICSKCQQNINALYSVFNILELSIYKLKYEENISLYQLLDSYSEEKKGDNHLDCPYCNKKVSAIQKMEIAHSPDILIIYINKVIDEDYYKNNISFPFKLDLTKYVKNEKNKTQIFNLIGTIEHHGNKLNGHYISKCKNFLDGKWYDFNDSFVLEDSLTSNIIDKGKNLNSNYVMLLFYQRETIF